MSEKTDLVLTDGKWITDGSGGNYSLEFKSGDYKYECNINNLSEDDTPPATLTIYKGEKEILVQPAKIIRD